MGHDITRGEVVFGLVTLPAVVGYHLGALETSSMPAILLAAAITGWVTDPLLTLVHELGHALPAARFTRQLVQVRLGRARS